jgi:hypothetical protein
MIINDKDALKRLDSPMNLINKLRSSDKRNNAMSLFGIGRKEEKLVEEVTVTFNPFKQTVPVKEESQTSLLPQLVSPLQALEDHPVLDNILENHESQIKLSLAHDKALELLNRSVEMMSLKLDDIKSDKLPSVIGAASKVVESIRKERAESSKNNKDRDVHFHFYTPQQHKMTDYEVIEVTQ